MKINYFFLILFAAVLCACSDDDNPTPVQTEFTGPQVAVGDGFAWTIITTNENGEPQSIGIQFDESALQNLPTGSMHADEFTLQLPTEVQVTPFDHVTLDWNEHGHPPAGVYDLPHFDMHFYFMSQSQRDQIGPNDTTEFNKPLSEEFLPPGYLETPGGVPRMGAHIIDLMSPENAGTGIFEHTFIYGKYDAKINFFEPMATKDFLDSKTSITKEIRHPDQWQRPGYYPSQYRIEFIEESNVYKIILENFIQN